MFVDLPQHIIASDEWLATSFSVRFCALQAGHVRIAFYYDYPDASTFRYRVHNFIDVLESCQSPLDRPEFSTAWFCYADGERLDRIVEAADIIVFCRARYSARINELILRAKNLNKQVIFDVDDFVIDTRYASLIAQTLDQNLYSEDVWNYWFGYIGRIAATLAMCDRVIATNTFLADRIFESTGKHVSVVPNFLNRKQLEYSDQIYSRKVDNAFARDGSVHIGYFSGSPSHNRDFRIASSAIAKIMKERAYVRLLLVGYIEVQGPLTNFSDRIDRMPMHNYINLQRLIGGVELNIVPLQDNMFTNCKSELKYFESAVVGSPTLATPTWAYSKIIRDKENGWLVREHEWYDKMQDAIECLYTSPSDFIDLTNRAREQARLMFSWENQYEALRIALVGA